MDPKFKKWPFLTIFRKFQKHGFSTIICHQNAKSGGPRVKNGHPRAKNVISRTSANTDHPRPTNPRKSSHTNEHSSLSPHPTNAHNFRRTFFAISRKLVGIFAIIKKQKNQCKMLYAIGTICISYLGCGGPQNSEIVFPRAIICCFIDEISLLSHFLFVIDQF